MDSIKYAWIWEIHGCESKYDRGKFECYLWNNVSLVPAVYVESGAMGAAYAASGANGVCEMPFAGHELLMDCYATNTVGNKRSTTVWFDSSKILEKKAWDLIGDDRFCGTASADPTQQAYFGIGLYSPTAGR